MKLIKSFVLVLIIVSSSIQDDRETTIISLGEERTLIIVKPDGVQRGLIGEVIRRLEAKGLKLIAIKMLRPSREVLEAHYHDIKATEFFEKTMDYMGSGPLVITVWEGFKAILYGRQILGLTSSPSPGTIRFDFVLSRSRNVVHGSDSIATANREIALWFKETELNPWEQANVRFIHGYDFIQMGTLPRESFF